MLTSELAPPSDEPSSFASFQAFLTFPRQRERGAIPCPIGIHGLFWHLCSHWARKPGLGTQVSSSRCSKLSHVPTISRVIPASCPSIS
jgi:hypothetical protein